jgi:uncharacterized protein (TIGR02145 family)
MKKIKIVSTLVASIAFTLTALAQSTPSYIPINGLVGYWPFNGNANDESGNWNNGTVIGATLTTDRFGNNNSCYNFNVNNWSWGSGGDEIYIPFNSSFNSSSISVSTWFMKTSDGTQGQGLTIINRFQYGYSNLDGETFLLRMEPFNQYALDAVILSAGTNINDQTGIANLGPYIQLNTWTHAVFTFDGFILKLYINGVLISSNSSPGFSLNTNGNSGISIGVSDQANGHWGPFDGKIDDVGLWNRALNQQEITQLYTASPAPTEVTIGTQTWTTKNLDVATYSDGTPIPQVQDATEWANLTTGAWCYYKNDPTNGAVYGKLYNWYAVAGIHDNDPNTPNKKLAPTGYHVPSDSEWTTLTDYLGGAGVAGGKMKEIGTTHWNSPNTDATNSSGFAGLPGGCRVYEGTSDSIGYIGYWWSSSEFNTTDAWRRDLDYYKRGIANRYSYSKRAGFSVRCIKDHTANPTASAQIFCNGATVASLVATGTDLKWYTTKTGGTALASDIALVTGTYYVSQTLDGYESPRTAVPVTQTPAMSAIVVANSLVNIGTQTWTTKNLDVATYSDGTVIPQVTNPEEWVSLTTGAWCYYNNDPANGAIYGKLYNWYAVAGIWNEASKWDATQRKNLAPTGYHVPSDSEWTALTTYLGGEDVAGKAMKETGEIHWDTSIYDLEYDATPFINTGNNSSGFKALGGGQCLGGFSYFGADGHWWSSSESDSTNAFSRGLYYELDYVNKYDTNKYSGFSVRCLVGEPEVVVLAPLDPNTITIGTQTWTTKNLDVATYRDGTVIPQVTDPTEWANLTTGAWCYYNNDLANGSVYGKLYNWYAVAGIWNEASKWDATQRKKLAPTGYHVPSNLEWTTLTTCLGGETVAGGKMKATGTSLWQSPNTDATNSAEFTALPGGIRSSDSEFQGIGMAGFWWSSTLGSTLGSFYLQTQFNMGNTSRGNAIKGSAFSVRCLRD